MAKASCPPPEQLRQFLLGELSEPQTEGLAHHLSDCDPCLRTVEDLRVDDTLLEELQHGVDVARQAAQAVQQGLMERIQALARAGKPHGLMETPTHPLDNQAACQPTTGSVPGGRSSASLAASFDFLAPAQAPDEIGRLGPYRVLTVLGQGGMGVVFRAEDVRLGRPVALKAMRVEFAQEPGARERFLREARAVAALEHDNIVAIHQVDEDRGVPYIAMPLLRGTSLEDELTQKPPGVPGTPIQLAQVLKIGREIAQGLAAAHARGLIHRDIKPGNIWLDATADGRVKLLDFGLARSTSGEQKLTQPGAIVGTPAYMAPEQAQGQKLDGRADLFSLGVVLYRLCTGELPFRGPDMITTLMALATHEPLPPRDLNPNLPPGLSELVMKLLAKDPAQRLGSAQEVMQALQAIEKDETPERTAAFPSAKSAPAPPKPPALARARVASLWPNIARPGTGPTHKPRRWWPVVAACTALVGLPLVFHIVTGLVGVDSDAKPAGGGASPAAKFVACVAAPPSPNMAIATLRGHTGPVCSVAFSANGKRLASGSFDGTVKVWDATTGQVRLTLKGHTSAVTSVAFSPEGKGLVSGSKDKTLMVWDARTGQHTLTLQGHASEVTSVAFSPDGRRLVSASGDRTVKVWDATTGQGTFTFVGHSSGVRSMAFSPDGKRLVSGSGDGAVKVWDVETGQETLTLLGHAGAVLSVAFSPDGKRLVSGSDDQTVKVWDARTGQAMLTLKGYTGPVSSVAFSPDGKRLVSGSEDRTVKVWDATTGLPTLTLQGHTGAVYSVAFSPDGERLVSGTADGTVGLWAVSRLAPAPATVLARSIGVNVDNLAPEIDGEDVDGKRFKLSAYRGKVVFLDFWGDWCPFCARMYAYKRALFKRGADKPLAVLGVECERHNDKLRAKRVMQREGINWPTWWHPLNQGNDLLNEWDIQGYPMLIVLDHKGEIRWRHAGALNAQECAELDRLIDELVADCERGTKTAGPR